MRRGLADLCLWLIVSLAGIQPGSACALRFASNFAIPEGRIAAAELSIRHGAVGAIREVPPGWVLTINNDPSWITTASGHALVGAAFLEPADIKGFFSITPEPGYECSSLRRQGHITLTLKLYRDDRFRWIALSRDSLDLLEH